MKKTKNKRTQKRKKQGFKEWIDSTMNTIIKEDILIDFLDIEVAYAKSNNRNMPDCIFSISYNKKYRSATIFVYPVAQQLYDNGKIKELTTGLTHELCHLHTIPVAELAKDRFVGEKELMDAFEEMTQIIAQYIIKGRKNKLTK